jgi:hypothetical protein
MKEKKAVTTSIPAAAHASTCIRVAAQSRALTALNLLNGSQRNSGTHNKQLPKKMHSLKGLHQVLDSVAGQRNRVLQVQKGDECTVRSCI